MYNVTAANLLDINFGQLAGNESNINFMNLMLILYTSIYNIIFLTTACICRMVVSTLYVLVHWPGVQHPAPSVSDGSPCMYRQCFLCVC